MKCHEVVTNVTTVTTLLLGERSGHAEASENSHWLQGWTEGQHFGLGHQVSFYFSTLFTP